MKMSKPLIPLKGGDEQDMLSPWRKVLKSADRPGAAKKAKRSYNKRVRREWSGALSEQEALAMNELFQNRIY